MVSTFRHRFFSNNAGLNVLGFTLLCYISISDMVNVAWDFVDDFTKTYTNFTSNNIPLLCDFYLNMKSSSAKASSLMIMAMALERFYATYYPFRYKDDVTVKKLTYVAFACVVYSVFSRDARSSHF